MVYLNAEGINIYKQYAQVDSLNSFLVKNKKAIESPEVYTFKKSLNIDFASESKDFSKSNVFSQTGSFNMSQRRVYYQHVMRLIQ